MRRSEIFGGKRELLLSILVSFGSVTVLPVQTGWAGGHEHGPIYRTLDALAGGIEKVIDVAASAKQRAGSRGAPLCDDGCDAILMDELMTIPHSNDLPMHDFASPPGFSPDMDVVPDTRFVPDMASPQADTFENVPSAQQPAQRPRRVMAPRVPSPPADTPRTMRPLPAPSQRAPTTTPHTSNDEWLESFSAEPRPQAPAVPRRQLDTQPKAKSGSGAVRNPAETFDSLPDPFRDDPQSNRGSKSMNRPASYWEPW